MKKFSLLLVLPVLCLLSCKRIPLYDPSSDVYLKLDISLETDVQWNKDLDLDVHPELAAKVYPELPEMVHVCFYDTESHKLAAQDYLPSEGGFIDIAPGMDDGLSGTSDPSITWEANPSDGASITFTNTKAAGIDLLWATANRKDKSSGAVELDFHHALARLELHVQVPAGSLNDGRLCLKSVALETSPEDRLALGGVFTIDNTRNVPTGTWSELTTLSDYAFFTGQDITFSSTGSTSLVGLLDGTARVARDGVAVPLVDMYVPRQANKNLVVTYSLYDKPETVQSVNLVRGDWEMGKQYTYCLEFAPPLVQITVRTVGQQKDDYYEDASSTVISTFNHSWGE